MSSSLPARPSLRQLQIQAKELARDLKQADPTAMDRLLHHHPIFASREAALMRPIRLSDAQLVIAREYGFASWAKLRAEVERTSLQRLAQAVADGNVPQARSLLRQFPELVNLDMSETDEHRVLHYAVLRRDEPMVRALMRAGADAHKGIYPHRDATTAYVFAKEREFPEIVAAIEQEEVYRREKLSCPNATVSAAQDQLAEHIRAGNNEGAIEMLEGDPTLAKACDREGGTPLHVSVAAGALPVVDWLLAHHANPRKKNIKGHTPLDAAVLGIGWRERERCTAVASVALPLLRHGAVLSPLTAAALGDLDTLRECDRRDAKGLRDGYESDGQGPLSAAVMFGRRDALKLLLEMGLDPNERFRLSNLEEEVITQGKPLWLAAAYGEYEIARLLLESGADPNAQVYASGTPVSRAYGARDGRMIELIAAHGGQPDPYLIGAYRDVATAIELLKGDCPEEVLSELLWGAACGGSPEIVKMTIGRLNWPMSDERWFRMLNAPLSLWNHAPHSEHPEFYDRSTYPECLRLILQHGVDANIQGRKGETLLHCISAKGMIWGRPVMTDDERMLFARIALGANPDLTRRDNLLKSTPLGWACRWGREGVVKLLLDHGARVTEPDAEPWATPLAWAKKRGHEAIASLLTGSE